MPPLVARVRPWSRLADSLAEAVAAPSIRVKSGIFPVTWRVYSPWSQARCRRNARASPSWVAAASRSNNASCSSPLRAASSGFDHGIGRQPVGRLPQGFAFADAGELPLDGRAEFDQGTRAGPCALADGARRCGPRRRCRRIPGGRRRRPPAPGPSLTPGPGPAHRSRRATLRCGVRAPSNPCFAGQPESMNRGSVGGSRGGTLRERPRRPMPALAREACPAVPACRPPRAGGCAPAWSIRIRHPPASAIPGRGVQRLIDQRRPRRLPGAWQRPWPRRGFACRTGTRRGRWAVRRGPRRTAKPRV